MIEKANHNMKSETQVSFLCKLAKKKYIINRACQENVRKCKKILFKMPAAVSDGSSCSCSHIAYPSSFSSRAPSIIVIIILCACRIAYFCAHKFLFTSLSTHTMLRKRLKTHPTPTHHHTTPHAKLKCDLKCCLCRTEPNWRFSWHQMSCGVAARLYVIK